MSIRPVLAGPVMGTVIVFSLLSVAVGWLAPARPAHAVTADLPGPEPTGSRSDSRALELLDRAAKAARTTSYEGVQFVSAWGLPLGTTSLVVDVQHVVGQGTKVRMRGTSALPAREVFSPEEGGVSGISGQVGNLAWAGGPVELLASRYDAHVADSGAVAGRQVDIVEVRRRDATPAARFWFDQATGLTLRREMYDESGAIVRASAFLDVTVNEPATITHLPPMLPAAWGATVSARDLAGFRARGWTCPIALDGGLTLWDARRLDGGRGGVLHLSYSDGLSMVSVFAQKGALDDDALGESRSAWVGDQLVHVTAGVPQQVVWSAGGTVYTVVADAAPETVRAVVSSFPHESRRTGIWQRVWRGVVRVTSWLNPFE